jgi:hypothetical protein
MFVGCFVRMHPKITGMRTLLRRVVVAGWQDPGVVDVGRQHLRLAVPCRRPELD